VSLHMMHIAAHCAHEVHRTLPVHMHIAPLGACAVCAVPAIGLEKRLNLVEYTSRVGGAHG
jgi:hypothetical protein